MELRVAKAVFESFRDYTVDVLEKWEGASRETKWQALFTARAAIRATPSPWLPIESAPTNETISFLIRRRGFVIQASWFEGRLYPDARECIIDWEHGITDATHWMPLPAPPDPPHPEG